MRLGCSSLAAVPPAAARASEPRPVAFDPDRRGALLRRRARRGRRRQAAPGRLERRSDGIRRLPQGASARQGRQAGDVPARLRRAQGRAATTTPRTHFDALVKATRCSPTTTALFAARAHLAAGRATQALDRGPNEFHPSARSTAKRVSCAPRPSALLARNADAAAEYRSYLEGYPTSWRAAEARFSLAEALEAAGDHDEARARVAQALSRGAARELGQAGGRRISAPTPTFTADELATRAMALFDAMRNAESEAEWKQVLGAPGPRRQADLRRDVPPGAERVQGARALARGAAVRRRRRGLRARPRTRT